METSNYFKNTGRIRKGIKMKFFLALLLFVVITTVSYGQNNYQDVVYLKNGGIIRGVIIEQVPNEFIKIETVGKNVFVYQ